ncbi:hypothetical protein Tco_1329214 [Tanacetum coccineum]
MFTTMNYDFLETKYFYSPQHSGGTRGGRKKTNKEGRKKKRKEEEHRNRGEGKNNKEEGKRGKEVNREEEKKSETRKVGGNKVQRKENKPGKGKGTTRNNLYGNKENNGTSRRKHSLSRYLVTIATKILSPNLIFDIQGFQGGKKYVLQQGQTEEIHPKRYTLEKKPSRSSYRKWMNGMDVEMRALSENGTWEQMLFFHKGRKELKETCYKNRHNKSSLLNSSKSRLASSSVRCEEWAYYTEILKKRVVY